MILAEQLAQARADFAALEGDTGKLKANVTEQLAELERLRREARANRSTFAEVVEQQTRWDAARGMLEQHLQDVANAQALAEELAAAHAEAEGLASASGTFARLCDLEARHAALSDEVEAYLGEKLAELRALEADHRAGQGELARLAGDQVSRAAGLGVGEFRELLNRTSRRTPQGPGAPLLTALREYSTRIAGEGAGRAEELIVSRFAVVPVFNTPRPGVGHPLLRAAYPVSEG